MDKPETTRQATLQDLDGSVRTTVMESMQRTGWTQRQIASEFGVSFQLVSQLLQERRRSDVAAFVRQQLGTNADSRTVFHYTDRILDVLPSAAEFGRLVRKETANVR